MTTLTDRQDKLSASAREVLLCLFIHGPTWDGDVPSKTGRDELYEQGLISRHQGYQWLLIPGIHLCFSLGIEREKQKYQHNQRKVRWDAERYATMKADPVGGRHWLRALHEGGVSAEDFDTMLDKLKVSRDAVLNQGSDA